MTHTDKMTHPWSHNCGIPRSCFISSNRSFVILFLMKKYLDIFYLNKTKVHEYMLRVLSLKVIERELGSDTLLSLHSSVLTCLYSLVLVKFNLKLFTVSSVDRIEPSL